MLHIQFLYISASCIHSQHLYRFLYLLFYIERDVASDKKIVLHAMGHTDSIEYSRYCVSAQSDHAGVHNQRLAGHDYLYSAASLAVQNGKAGWSHRS